MRTEQNRFRVRYPHLTAARDAAGLTDPQVASAAGITYSRWRGLLTGRCALQGEEIARLCAVLGVDPADVPHVHRPEATAPTA